MDVIEGGCLCGAVRYRADGPPAAQSVCHCESCRRAAGAPSMAWTAFALNGFDIISGAPAYYQSSPDARRGFCSRCGTSLFFQEEDGSGLVDIATATLDQPSAFPPLKETWTSDRLAWVEPNPARQLFPRGSRKNTE